MVLTLFMCTLYVHEITYKDVMYIRDYELFQGLSTILNNTVFQY